MLAIRTLPIIVIAALAPLAAGQISSIDQERSVESDVMVSSGAADSGADAAANFGPFVRSILRSVNGAGGAKADALANQDSALTSSAVTGSLLARCAANTGATFITGDATAQSDFLYIFSLAAPTQVNFSASGALSYIGRNPDGEPSDLSGLSRVRLLDSNTLDMIAGFQLFDEPGTDSASFIGTLPAGAYVILASAHMHAFSADLLGPPPRSGSGEASASFSLTVVPSPGAAAVLGIGGLAMARRRRQGRAV